MVATTPRQWLNERRKLRQWQAAQMRAFPSLDDLFDDPEEARKAFMEAFEEVIAEDPFFSAFEFELAENPDADPNAIATVLELAYPDDAPDDPDRPCPKPFLSPLPSAFAVGHAELPEGQRETERATAKVVVAMMTTMPIAMAIVVVRTMTMTQKLKPAPKRGQRR